MLSKFLNTKTLIVLLIIVLGIYFISGLFENEDRTFRSDLVSVDTAEINKIIITPMIGAGDEIIFHKTGTEWSIKSAGKSYKSDKLKIKNILTKLSLLRPERVAATDESKWKEFEVTDSTSTKVTLMTGDNVKSEIYLGKFSYTQPPQGQGGYQQQSQGKMSTFVRLKGEKEVYVVDGFLKMEIQPKVEAYRDNTLLITQPENLTKLVFSYPGNDNFTLSHLDNKWMINGMEVDSTKTMTYLNKLRRVNSNDFIDEVNPVTSTPTHTLKIEGNNMIPAELKAFPVAETDTINQFIMVSSRIPESKFSGGKNQLFEKVFPKKEDFYPNK